MGEGSKAKAAEKARAVAAQEWLDTAVLKKKIHLKTDSQGAFLEALVGLTHQECEEVAFDGEQFHFRELIPLEKVTLVTSSNAQYVKVADASIPHEDSYTYTRKDGGPDLRYSSNPKVMWAWSTTLTFSVAIGTPGGEQVVKVFRSSSQASTGLHQVLDASATADKINSLVLLSKNPSFHGSRRLFEAEFDAIHSANAAIPALEIRVGEISEAISALERLVRDKKVNEQESRSDMTYLTYDLDKQKTEVSKLKTRKSDADHAMKSIAESLASYADYKEDLAKVAKVGLAPR